MQKYKSTNWKDWIYERFENKEKYEILFNEEYAEYSIKSTKPNIETIIYFSFMNNEDNEVLYDIHFSRNDKEDNYRWVSPFTIDKEYKPTLLEQIKAGTRLETSLFYNEKFIERLEKEWLDIPLNKGWKEELNFIGTKIFRAKLKIKGSREMDWSINEKNTYLLNNWETLKLILGIEKSIKTFNCESIE
jgi:hypothetical protein